VEAVSQGRQFVSVAFAGHIPADLADGQVPKRLIAPRPLSDPLVRRQGITIEEPCTQFISDNNVFTPRLSSM
jgi:hypothetical protein